MTHHWYWTTVPFYWTTVSEVPRPYTDAYGVPRWLMPDGSTPKRYDALDEYFLDTAQTEEAVLRIAGNLNVDAAYNPLKVDRTYNLDEETE